MIFNFCISDPTFFSRFFFLVFKKNPSDFLFNLAPINFCAPKDFEDITKTHVLGTF
jgi:hypothetical protein